MELLTFALPVFKPYYTIFFPIGIDEASAFHCMGRGFGEELIAHHL
jgi:hypothetical protein